MLPKIYGDGVLMIFDMGEIPGIFISRSHIIRNLADIHGFVMVQQICPTIEIHDIMVMMNGSFVDLVLGSVLFSFLQHLIKYVE